MELRSLNVRLKSLLIAVQVKESQTYYNINELHIATIDPKHQPYLITCLRNAIPQDIIPT
jgi:hypothetical protein